MLLWIDFHRDVKVRICNFCFMKTLYFVLCYCSILWNSLIWGEAFAPIFTPTLWYPWIVGEVLYFSRFLLAGPVILYHRRCRVLQNSMICWYLRCGFVEFIRQVFDRMPKWVWPIKDGLNVELDLFEKMPAGDFTWDAYHLFNQMPKQDAVGWANTRYGYAKIGSNVVLMLLGNVRKRWCCYALMSGYLQNGCCL
jgi:pentatricopeptide repeat protein